jgi:uncharacterized protein (TIGR00369 family)
MTIDAVQEPGGTPNRAAVKLPPEIVAEWAAIGIDLAMLASAGSLGSKLGINVTEASANRVVGTMPVSGNTQPAGLLHGGATAALAETLASVGAMLHGRTAKIPVGVDLNCTHHRGVASGTVTGIAVPLHCGRTTATYEVVITDDTGKRVCTARLTCLLRDRLRPTNAVPDPGEGIAS